jgi:FdhD protein
VSEKKYTATRIVNEKLDAVEDALVLEAPLQITVNGTRYVTTMRTPDAYDHELVLGLLFTEGIVSRDGASMSSTEINDPETGLTACLEIELPESSLLANVEGRKNQWSTSSCGVCGTRDAEDIVIYGPPIEIEAGGRLEKSRIPSLLKKLEANQALFQETGGCHGAAIFDLKGTLLVVREDIGRHNAVDKAIGSLLKQDELDRAGILLVSGRVSYEIVYKSYRAGIPILLSVSAPSSMAVDTCIQFGITLAAFCRGEHATVYAHPERITGMNQ